MKETRLDYLMAFGGLAWIFLFLQVLWKWTGVIPFSAACLWSSWGAGFSLGYFFDKVNQEGVKDG